MEKTAEGLSAGPSVTKDEKSSGKVTQDMETTDMSKQVTDVNQKDSPVNQSSFVILTFASVVEILKCDHSNERY